MTTCFYLTVGIPLAIDLFYILGFFWQSGTQIEEDFNYDQHRKQLSQHMISTAKGSKDVFEQLTDSFISKTEWFYSQYANKGAELKTMRVHFVGILLLNAGAFIYLLYLCINNELIEPAVRATMPG